MRVLPDRPYHPRQDPIDRRRLMPYGTALHPAKMYVALAMDLVRRYTLPGQHILDPCFGIGTTAVGLLLGRYVIGIEYEPHHAESALKNARHLARIAHDMGKVGYFSVLQGDSRERIPELFNLGPEASITSPAYESSLNDSKHEGFRALSTHKGAAAVAAARRAKGGGLVSKGGYGTDYSADATITSSAFGEMNAPHRGGTIKQRPTKDGEGFEGDKDHFVYGSMAASEFQEVVDAHILSPAYVDQLQSGQEPEKQLARLQKKAAAGELVHPAGGRIGQRGVWGGGLYRYYPQGYDETPEGSVDGTILSPGYATNRIEQHESTNDLEKRQQRIKKAGGKNTTPRPNDPYWNAVGYNDPVDASLTSPAYEKVASRDRHLEPYARKDPERARKYGQDSPSRNVSGYGKGGGQIGNMKLKDGTYQAAMRDIYARCLEVTRPGGVLVTVTGNYLQGGHFGRTPDGQIDRSVYVGGEMIDLASLTIELCVEAGWTPYERWRAVKRSLEGKPSVSFWRTTQAKQGMPLIDYEDVLCFVKGDEPAWDLNPLDNGRWP